MLLERNRRIGSGLKMTGIHQQIDALEAAFKRLRKGELQTFNELPFLLDTLRQSATDLEHRQEELGSLYEVTQEIVSILELDDLLESILDRAIVLVGAERGFLVLYDPRRSPDDFQVAAARQFSSGDVDDAQIEVSHGLMRRVLSTREPVVTTNAQEDPRFQTSNSVVTYQIRSVLATPMLAKEELIGAIYVDTRLSSRLFRQADLALLSAMANQAAAAVQMARLYQDLYARNLELQVTLRELQNTQDELTRAERLSLVGRMTASIIHDLKNPMTAIKGYASILGRQHLDPALRERYSKTIGHAVDRFVDMTQEILDYTRGGGDLSLSSVHLDEFVRDLCDFLRPAFDERKLALKCEVEDMGRLVMDETKIRRSLYNIASNANDAMEPGGTLTLTVSRTDAYVEFCLSDTGPGIPPQIQDKLFEPFVTYGKPSGTGLGLAIAKKAIEDHGGTITADSAPGQGTTFVIRLPARLHRE
jgi:signal transduction histidine kinase